MQELMSRHKAYSLNPRDCLKTTLFQKWQRMVAPPGKRGTFLLLFFSFNFSLSSAMLGPAVSPFSFRAMLSRFHQKANATWQKHRLQHFRLNYFLQFCWQFQLTYLSLSNYVYKLKLFLIVFVLIFSCLRFCARNLWVIFSYFNYDFSHWFKTYWIPSLQMRNDHQTSDENGKDRIPEVAQTARRQYQVKNVHQDQILV